MNDLPEVDVDFVGDELGVTEDNPILDSSGTPSRISWGLSSLLEYGEFSTFGTKCSGVLLGSSFFFL